MLKTISPKYRQKQKLKDMDEAFLSLDMAKIQKFFRKYGLEDNEEDCVNCEYYGNCDIGAEECFWALVHMARTAMKRLPEGERWKSIFWLAERGYGNMANDMVRKDLSIVRYQGHFGNSLFKVESRMCC